jgi:hypothetical protein
MPFDRHRQSGVENIWTVRCYNIDEQKSLLKITEAFIEDTSIRRTQKRASRDMAESMAHAGVSSQFVYVQTLMEAKHTAAEKLARNSPMLATMRMKRSIT